MFSDSQIYKQKDMSDLIKRKSKDKHKNGRKKGQVKWPDPNQQPRVAIQRMRSVVGALLYMTNNKVNQIFVNQVDRIGAQLDNIENALPKTPRTKMKKVKGADNKEVEITVTFNKWEHLDLKKKWFDYMDGVYTRANDKANAFMKTNFKELNDEYDSKKMIKQDDINKEKDKDKQKKMKEEKKLRDDMKDYIAKLETEWTKANNWSKPKWNSKTPEAGT
jgi:hypothetical protein